MKKYFSTFNTLDTKMIKIHFGFIKVNFFTQTGNSTFEIVLAHSRQHRWKKIPLSFGERQASCVTYQNYTPDNKYLTIHSAAKKGILQCKKCNRHCCLTTGNYLTFMVMSPRTFIIFSRKLQFQGFGCSLQIGHKDNLCMTHAHFPYLL